MADTQGMRKAAILLASIEQETSALIMKQLSREECQLVSMECERLKPQPCGKEERDTVLREFFDTWVVRKDMTAHMRSILTGTFTPEDVELIIKNLETSTRFFPVGRAKPMGPMDFNGIIRVNDRDIRELLKNINTAYLSLALKAAPPS